MMLRLGRAWGRIFIVCTEYIGDRDNRIGYNGIIQHHSEFYMT